MTKRTALAALMLFPLRLVAQSDALEQQVRRSDAQEVHALLANDTRALRELWSDDFVVTNPLNQFVTKEQVLALVTSGTLAFASYERRIEYVKVYGDVVVVAGSETVVWAGTMPNAGATSLLRFTAVWMKQGRGVREVARHANIIRLAR